MSFDWKIALKMGCVNFTASDLIDHFFISKFNIRRSVPSVHPARTDFATTILAPLFQGVACIGLLDSKKNGWGWTLARNVSHLFLSMTAARALVGRRVSHSGFTKDVEMAFLWTAARELFHRWLPKPSSIFIPVSDATVFALIGLCPHQDKEPIPLFSDPWKYKFLSSFFFRLVEKLGLYLVRDESRTPPSVTTRMAAFILQNGLFNMVRYQHS